MNRRVWYAVMDNSDDIWDNGSWSFTEAKEMLLKKGYGIITAIDTNIDDPLYEIGYNELVEDDEKLIVKNDDLNECKTLKSIQSQIDKLQSQLDEIKALQLVY